MSVKMEKAREEESWLIKPLPGYVCKWKNVKLIASDEFRKCFVNVCHCSQLPPPIDDLDQEQIAEQLDGGNPNFKIPISVGEIDCVKDRKEENSIKIDVLVNSTFYQKRLSSSDDTFFRHLLAMIFCDLIEKKHNLVLDPLKPIILRNRVAVGDLETQKINKRPEKQIVEEMYQEDLKRMEKMETQETDRVKNELLGIRDIENLRMRLFDGKRLEISMVCAAKGSKIKDSERLALRLTPTRCRIDADKSIPIFDFDLPFTINISTAKSKFIDEKSLLVVSVDIILDIPQN